MPSRFRFKGSAYAAAGVITTPFNEVIPTQASANLAVFGGYGVAHSEKFCHRNIIRFERAHSEVTGSKTHRDKPGETYSTLAKASVEGLDIMGMITADRVVANLVSTYRIPEATKENPCPWKDVQPEVRLVGSRFENLKIAGVPVRVHLNLDVLDKHHTHRALRCACEKRDVKDALFGGEELRKRHATAPPEVREFLNEPPHEECSPDFDDVVTTSIVKSLEPEGTHIECFGHVVYIEGFGVIRFGEVRVCKLTRHLSMIQVKLGCPVEGNGNVGVVDDGGSKGN